ncbi:MAG: response regulator transcription factor [Thiolinea sp.]
MVNKKKVLVVEDDSILCDFLCKFLVQNDYEPQGINDGSAIPKALNRSNIDLIILDRILPNPEKDGFYWLSWINEYYPHIPTVIISMLNSKNDRLSGLENGAVDYIIKPFYNKEVLLRINRILTKNKPKRKEKYFVIGNMKVDIDGSRVIIGEGEEDVRLTSMEAELLRLLYINQNTALNRDEIMLNLKGTEHNPLDRSIDIHINKLRKKLESNPSKPQYIRTIRGKGYKLVTS